jgi:hypothetical protein
MLRITLLAFALALAGCAKKQSAPPAAAPAQPSTDEETEGTGDGEPGSGNDADDQAEPPADGADPCDGGE